MITLYDTYTEKNIDIKTKKINIYNCGPTVYNHIHIGNARPLIIFDVLYRFLLKQKYNVEYIMNITDIDDKIIDQSIKENIPELELSNHYYLEYKKIQKQLNVLEIKNPKVSDYIDQMINFIDKLIKNNSAYIVDGNVYFDTSCVKNYGKLSKKITDELVIGSRINQDHNKKNPNDFVLWKRTSKGITWNSPWSCGRPGWHTECVLLINEFFGNDLTIHGGGMDLKFPHHENENAQCCALFNKNLSEIWMHIGIVNINNQKMSKSLNNFILVKDILTKFSPNVLRWFFYQSNYSSVINYTNDIMQMHDNKLNQIEMVINQSKNLIYLDNKLDEIKINDELDNKTIDILSNNLDISNLISYVYELVKELNIYIRSKDTNKLVKTLNCLLTILDVLGIFFENKHNDENLELLDKWKKAKDNDNFQLCDEIRDILKSKGLW